MEEEEKDKEEEGEGGGGENVKEEEEGRRRGGGRRGEEEEEEGKKRRRKRSPSSILLCFCDTVCSWLLHSLLFPTFTHPADLSTSSICICSVLTSQHFHSSYPEHFSCSLKQQT